MHFSTPHKHPIAFFFNTIVVILSLFLITACGSSGGGGGASEYRVVIKADNPDDVLDPTNPLVNAILIVRGKTVRIQVDIPNLPTGESITGFASDLNETTSGISIGTGTPICEKWTITATEDVPTANLDAHHQAFGAINANIQSRQVKVSAVGETLPVINGAFLLRVLSPHVTITDAGGTAIVSGERAGGGTGIVNATVGDTVTIQYRSMCQTFCPETASQAMPSNFASPVFPEKLWATRESS